MSVAFILCYICDLFPWNLNCIVFLIIVFIRVLVESGGTFIFHKLATGAFWNVLADLLIIYGLVYIIYSYTFTNG